MPGSVPTCSQPPLCAGKELVTRTDEAALIRRPVPRLQQWGRGQRAQGRRGQAGSPEPRVLWGRGSGEAPSCPGLLLGALSFSLSASPAWGTGGPSPAGRRTALQAPEKFPQPSKRDAPSGAVPRPGQAPASEEAEWRRVQARSSGLWAVDGHPRARPLPCLASPGGVGGVCLGTKQDVDRSTHLHPR